MKRKVVLRVSNMNDQKSRTKALKIAVTVAGVESVALGGEAKNEIVVTGEGIDAVKLASLLRKSVGFADVLSVGDTECYADGQRIASAADDDSNVVQGRQLQPIVWGNNNNYGGGLLDVPNYYHDYAAYDRLRHNYR
ncbi:Heavy metal-associated isoprenylated plant protein 16, partial [Linum grandiflorum]